MRLNKYLAACGLGSRRGVEELILGGKVRVNGEVADSLATQITSSDEVIVGGRKLRPQGMLVIAVYKPKGYVCTRSDEKDRRTLYDLLPREFHSLHHIGRLDMDSSGLILLTNDGDLSHRLTHPSKGIEKEYEVTVEEPLDETVVPKCIKGMMTPEGFGKAERAWIIGNYKIGMVLKQGLKRQIRHMLYYCGHEVRRLERVRIGNFYLKGMREGSWKELSKSEVDRLIADAAAAAAKTRRPSAPEKDFEGEDSAAEPAPKPVRRGPVGRKASHLEVAVVIAHFRREAASRAVVAVRLLHVVASHVATAVHLHREAASHVATAVRPYRAAVSHVAIAVRLLRVVASHAAVAAHRLREVGHVVAVQVAEALGSSLR